MRLTLLTFWLTRLFILNPPLDGVDLCSSRHWILLTIIRLFAILQ